MLNILLQLLEERRPEAAGPWAQHAVLQTSCAVLPAPGHGELLAEVLTLGQW
jgi:hypothetical protein